MELLFKLIFQNFWTFLGTLILIYLFFNGIETSIRAFRQAYKVSEEEEIDFDEELEKLIKLYKNYKESKERKNSDD